MGLLLRPDAYYAETSDGAYILTHHGASAFTGRSVHSLIDRLAPFLDGRHTLAELTADLPAERADLVRKLVTTLIERDVVRDTAPDVASGAGPLRPEAGFVGYFRDFPDAVFRQYEDKVTLVVGAGRLCRAVAVAAVRSGLGQVRVVTTAECPTDLAGLGALGGGWRGERPWPDGDLPRGETGEAVRSLIDGVDLVLHASDRPMVERAGLLDRLCEESGVLLAQALVLDGHAWIGTAGLGGRDGLSWTSARHRLLARHPVTTPPPRPGTSPEAFSPPDDPPPAATAPAGIAPAATAPAGIAPAATAPAGIAPDATAPGGTAPDATAPGRAAPGRAVPDETVPDEAAAAVVAGQLVHGVFRSITGSAAPPRNQVTRVDLATLDGEVCAFVPHPFAMPAPVVPGVADRVASLRAGARLDDDTFSRRAAVCAGDHVGVFGAPGERDFAQIPLHVCEIEVSDPAGLLGPGAPALRVTGAGLDFAAARYQAALRAFAGYASLMLDPRRLHSVAGRPPGPRADPGETLSGLRSGRLSGHVQGYGIADSGTHLVDVTRAFPALRPAASAYVPPPGVAAAPVHVPPPGVAAAYDWDEAVTRGLAGQCERLTMDGLAQSPAPYPRVDLAGAALDARGDRYRALLAAIGEPVTVYDVTGPLGVPAVVCYLGAVPAGRAAAPSAAEAVTGALEQALLRYQARENGQPAYAPPPVRGIPERLRGTATRPLPGGPPLDAAGLAAALVARGHRPIAVPLDHDPEVGAIMPYTVHVVIVDD
ncbi:YcaO-like family protein [Sphaerisporangium corydalis]|uniref:YcaO-like family protein n=1 Tax=Sphaerisporangium corydalis TaxID=1441875 RepID=A0ABV9EBD9_9ACTN|nr:hypothetical protein [Sphaerisporangium corydalis]